MDDTFPDIIKRGPKNKRAKKTEPGKKRKRFGREKQRALAKHEKKKNHLYQNVYLGSSRTRYMLAPRPTLMNCTNVLEEGPGCFKNYLTRRTQDCFSQKISLCASAHGITHSLTA